MELEQQYLVTPNGTISRNVDLFNGGTVLASPEPRSILANSSGAARQCDYCLIACDTS